MVEYQVIGARGRVERPKELLRRLQMVNEGNVLALDADLVCGKEHLESAVAHALRSFSRNSNSCNDIMMETLLFASGERQISKAQEKMGPKPGSERIALVLFGAPPSMVLRLSELERDDSVLECNERKTRSFGITQREIEAVGDDRVQDLVLERVAFVEISKR